MHKAQYLCQPQKTRLYIIKGTGMASSQNIQLVIHVNDPTLDLEERDRDYLRLLWDLKEHPEVESVSPISAPIPPPLSKGVVSSITGLLTAEISRKNLTSVFQFLYGRLSKNAIELEVEAHGKRLKVRANSREDLTAAIQNAQDFISQR